MSRLLYFGNKPSPDEFKKHGLMVGTYSEMTCRRRCPKMHDYCYKQKLEKKIPSMPLTLGVLGHSLLEAKYSRRDGEWREELSLYITNDWGKLLEDQQEEYGDLPEMAHRLLVGYEYNWKNESWNVLETEVSFLARLTGKVGYAGVIDLIVEDSNGMIWVVDHKFTKNIPDDDYLSIDPQTSLYYWVATLKYGKDRVAGSILNYIRTKPPTVPSVNKDGTISKAKIDTDIPTLMKVIHDNDLDPDDYKDHIERAKVTTAQFYVRKRLDRPINLLKMTLREAVATILDCNSKRPITRTLNKNCSWDCDYQPLCMAEIQGADTNFMIKQQYQVKKDKNKEVFKSV